MDFSQEIEDDPVEEAFSQNPDPVPLSQGLSSDSDHSSDNAAGPCIRCVEEPNLISICHLQENPDCLAACMRVQLPRAWWTSLPASEVDTSELLFNLGIRLNLCLNTESCPLPNGDMRRVAFARHLTDSAGCLQFFRSTAFIIQKEWHALSAFELGRRRQRRKEMMVHELEEMSELGPVGFQKMMKRQMTEACFWCGVQGPLLRDFMLEERRQGLNCYHILIPALAGAKAVKKTNRCLLMDSKTRYSISASLLELGHPTSLTSSDTKTGLVMVSSSILLTCLMAKSTFSSSKSKESMGYQL